MSSDEGDSDASDSDSSSSLSELADRIAADDSTTPSRTTGSLSELADRIASRDGRSPDRGDADRSDADADADGWAAVDDDPAFDAETEALLDLVGDAANVLLAGPTDHPSAESLCARLLSSRRDVPVNVLVVTVTDTPGQRLSTLENYLTSPVGETTVIDVQNYNREVSYGQYDGPVDIRRVSSAQDLRRIGIMISKVLTEWDDAPGESVLCFHSVSDLLALTDDPQRVFRFLHVLRGRTQSGGVRAHFHFDPSRHEGETARTFQSLFDTGIRFDEDGSVSPL